MINLESNIPIYESNIEMYFNEYFENRGIDLSGDGYKNVPMNVYQSAFRYVYKKLFKPPEGTTRKYQRRSLIDYDDIDTLEKIVDIFGDIVTMYNIKSTQNMFCDLTGISNDTLWEWETGRTRSYIYCNTNNERITDIQEYMLNNKGEYYKVLSTSHSELVKRIKSFSYITAYNGLNDTPLGQTVHANNSPEAGMEYNNKRQMETARAVALTAAELPKLSDNIPQNSLVTASELFEDDTQL